MATELTWLGHSAFRLDSNGTRIYVDPLLHGNSKCAEGEAELERCELIPLTDSHNDHLGDTVAIAQKLECPVVAQVELRGWLSLNGLSSHHGRFPLLTGTPDELRRLVPEGIEILSPEPGETLTL